MRIVHCCLSFEYVDDLAYQENILPFMHQKLGHIVTVIASSIVARAGMDKYSVRPGKYVMKNGVTIIRVESIKLPYVIQSKLHIHKSIMRLLESLSPDLIFVHELNSLSILEIDKFVRKHPKVRFMVDNHNDYYNSGRNWISLNILHKGLYRALCGKIQSDVEVFWGTLPVRCEFLEVIYKAPKSKIAFLPMGVDDTNVDYDSKDEIRKKIRESLGFSNRDIVIICGGKLDKHKKIRELIEAILILPDNVKLLIFGKPSSEFKEEFNALIHNNAKVVAIGWIDSAEVYNYFFSADLACFPGGHSVLWEQAVACGLPAIFGKHEGMNHVDLGGNSRFIDDVTSQNIAIVISSVIQDKKYKNMAKVAEEKGREAFSYYEIAKRSLNNNLRNK